MDWKRKSNTACTPHFSNPKPCVSLWMRKVQNPTNAKKPALFCFPPTRRSLPPASHGILPNRGTLSQSPIRTPVSDNHGESSTIPAKAFRPCPPAPNTPKNRSVGVLRGETPPTAFFPSIRPPEGHAAFAPWNKHRLHRPSLPSDGDNPGWRRKRRTNHPGALLRSGQPSIVRWRTSFSPPADAINLLPPLLHICVLILNDLTGKTLRRCPSRRPGKGCGTSVVSFPEDRILP